MGIIMKLRQARNPEQVAAEIVPLAEALASLANETTEVLSQLQQSSQEQARTWNQEQQAAAEAWKRAAESIAQAARQAEEAATRLKSAANGQTWRTLLACVTTAAMCAGLAILSWLWLAPTPEVRNTLDPAVVAEHLKPALIEALQAKPTAKPTRQR
jgi:ferric-dicitrate binding protein FerR (iron transport regulator)